MYGKCFNGQALQSKAASSFVAVQDYVKFKRIIITRE